MLDRLCEEETASGCFLIHRLRKPRFFIDPPGSVIVFQDLQGELAAPYGPRFFFNRRQEPATCSLPPMFGQHCQVVNVDERPGCERRKPDEAHRDTDGFIALIGKEDDSGGVLLQPGYQGASDLRRKRSAIAHRISGVRIDEIDDSMLMLRPVEVSFHNFNGRHLKRFSS